MVRALVFPWLPMDAAHAVVLSLGYVVPEANMLRAAGGGV
jgi:hypothetical protein